ncbi:MAG TPA: hypothetical protein VGC15_11170 [Acetobacteraceae bacterium]
MSTPANPRKATLRIVVLVVLLTALYVAALRWPAIAAMLHQAAK